MAPTSSELWFSTERVSTGKWSSIRSDRKRERYARRLREALADYHTRYTALSTKFDRA
jgi:hypothetical protein